MELPTSNLELGSAEVQRSTPDLRGCVRFFRAIIGTAGALACVSLLAQPGTLDPSFNPGLGPNGLVYALAVQADGRILVGGAFNEFKGLPAGGIVRLKPDGSVDSTFDVGTGANSTVGVILVRPDQRVLIGGQFSQVNRVARPGLAQLLPNGRLDLTFAPGPPVPSFYEIRALALDADGSCWFGGLFVGFLAPGFANVGKLSASGSPDPTFGLEGFPDRGVIGVYPDTLGRAVLVGQFETVNGSDAGSFCRFFPNGQRDPFFRSRTGASPFLGASAGAFPSGYFIGGQFSEINGLGRAGLARLTDTGQVDPGFDPGRGSTEGVDSLAALPDGRVLVGGVFQTFAGLPLQGVVRLLADGKLDTRFGTNRAINGGVYALAVQPDGQVLLGGGFQFVDGVARQNLARLHGDARITFETNAVFALAGAGPATITVRRLGAPQPTVGVTIKTEDDTAVAGTDYTARTQAVTFGPGQTTASFSVPLLNHAQAPFNRTFRARMSSPTGGAELGAIPAVTVTVVETNKPGSLAVDRADIWLGESDGVARILVRRTGGGTNVLTVNYATQPGTAQSSGDFVAQQGALTFGPADAVREIRVPITDDLATEPTETFTVLLTSAAGGAALGTLRSTTVHVADDIASYEDIYGHRLRIEASGLVAMGDSFSGFMSQLAIRNPSPGFSRTGLVELTSLDPGFRLRFALPSIAGGDRANVVVGGDTEFAPSCPFDHGPPGSCTNRFTATVYEATASGLRPQDAMRVFEIVNTQPPDGGPLSDQAGGPGGSGPPVPKELFIDGPDLIESGTIADFRAQLQLSDGQFAHLVVEWSSSVPFLKPTEPPGRFQADPVDHEVQAQVRATRRFGNQDFSAAHLITITSPRPVTLSTRRTGDGKIEIIAAGRAGSSYVLERTTSLKPPAVWAAIETRAAGSDGRAQWQQPILPTGTGAFYRVRKQ